MSKLLDRSEYKSSAEPTTGVFQIMIDRPSTQHEGQRDYYLIGTGFLISKHGLFLTAKHVLDDDVDDGTSSIKAWKHQNGNGLVALIVCNGKAFPCPIHDTFLHQTADVALGVIALPDLSNHKDIVFSMALCSVLKDKASMKEKIVSFGFQRSEGSADESEPGTVSLDLNPKYYDGHIIAYHTEKFMNKTWPVYEVDMPIASGLSGSPVLSFEHQAVIGVVCSGWSTKDEDIEHGTVTDIRLALDMPVPHGLRAITNCKTVREVLIQEKLLI